MDDFVFPAVFARRTKAVAEAYGLTPDDLSTVSRKAYRNASLNPLAHMHHVGKKAVAASAATGGGGVGGGRSWSDAVNFEGDPCFLSNDDLKPYLRVSDCSQVSDGGK